MKILETGTLNDVQKEAIFTLWNNEYSEKLRYHSMTELKTYLDGLSNVQHFLLVYESEAILGWAPAFTRQGERWFAIILSGSIHSRGLGSKLLNKLKENEDVLNGWVTDHSNDLKADGTNYKSPLPFYLKNGFTVNDSIRLSTEKLSAVKITWHKHMTPR